jgi:hypothetical protein
MQKSINDQNIDPFVKYDPKIYKSDFS